MNQPWLVWLSGLNAGLQTKGLPVRFSVRAYAWVEGQVPKWGCVGGNHTLMFLSHSLSFPYPSLKVNQNLKKKKVIILNNTKLPTDTVQCLLSKARVPNPCLPGPSKEYQKAEQVSQIGASRSYKCVLKKDSTHLV